MFGLKRFLKSALPAFLGIENRIITLTSQIMLSLRQPRLKNFQAYTVTIFRI